MGKGSRKPKPNPPPLADRVRAKKQSATQAPAGTTTGAAVDPVEVLRQQVDNMPEVDDTALDGDNPADTGEAQPAPKQGRQRKKKPDTTAEGGGKGGGDGGGNDRKRNARGFSKSQQEAIDRAVREAVTRHMGAVPPSDLPPSPAAPDGPTPHSAGSTPPPGDTTPQPANQSPPPKSGSVAGRTAKGMDGYLGKDPVYRFSRTGASLIGKLAYGLGRYSPTIAAIGAAAPFVGKPIVKAYKDLGKEMGGEETESAPPQPKQPEPAALPSPDQPKTFRQQMREGLTRPQPLNPGGGTDIIRTLSRVRNLA